MKLLDIRPAPPGGGSALARFDVQLDCGIQLLNLKLARSKRGLRVFAASAFGAPTATFTHSMCTTLARLAAEAIGENPKHEKDEAR